ncbi:MAG: iron-siderophore ABC transporter substrate-binding protein [Pseudaminobacter sp.]
MQLSRRRLLAMAGAAVVSRAQAAARRPDRVAVIDWAMLETALAMGIVPVAAPELMQYRQIVVEPPVPPATADFGLRGTPSYELLRMTAPDLILSSNFYARQLPNLERIAPVVSATVYEPVRPTYALAQEAARVIGEAAGRQAEAQELIARSAVTLDHAATVLRPLTDRPVFTISIGDARHFRAFGPDSMPGDVMTRLGFRNAWHSGTSYSAAAPVSFEALAQVPEAYVVIIEPVPPEAQPLLTGSRLWQALPTVRERRVVRIGAVNHFGGLPSAQRFARLLAEALTGAAWDSHG